MSNTEIVDRIKATIDQFYSYPQEIIEKEELHFIGGVLRTALHLIPTKDYYEVKEYIYRTYGYDPGGCKDGQIQFYEII